MVGDGSTSELSQGMGKSNHSRGRAEGTAGVGISTGFECSQGSVFREVQGSLLSREAASQGRESQSTHEQLH